MENATEVADVLDKAADELVIRGWHTGSFVNAAGAVCLLGAVACARGLNLVEEPYPWDELDEDPAVIALAEAVVSSGGRKYGMPTATVYSWNDGADGGDIEEDDVHDLLRETAKGLRG